MRTLPLSVAMIVVAGSFLSSGARASRADDIVVQGDQSRTYDCHGGSLTVEGGSNVLTLRNCSRLIVNGGENTIDAGFVDTIVVEGADNKVTWWESADGRRPGITNGGNDNVIVSKRAPAGAAPKAQAPPAAAPAKTAPASAAGTNQITVSGGQVKVQGTDGTVTVGANGTVTLKEGAASAPAAAPGKIRVDKDGQKEVHDCRGGTALVNGDRNDLTFSNCSQISVNGSANVVSVRSSRAVSINGDDNKLSWEAAADGSRPVITDNGKGNTVSGKR